MTKKQLETYKNTYDRYDGIPNNEFDSICDELINYKKLEEQIGCPLEVRCKITTDTMIFDAEGNSFEVSYIDINNFTAIMDDYEFNFEYKDYKKTWWLRKDKSR